jgi:ribose transport system ATP-binding protein
MNTSPIISFEGITKRFPGVVALDSINLDIRRGETHVLVGENGAGKSSLVKVLCGYHLPEEGSMKWFGNLYAPHTPLDAIHAGIRVVYQEFNLLSNLSIAENLFFERLPSRHGVVDFTRLFKESEELLKRVGLEIDPRTPVELLGVAQMQLIEIAKAIAFQSELVVLDEPTATLTENEITKLFAIIRQLKADGVTIIYISHRLAEVFEIGDRITVLRNGKVIGTKDVNDTSIPDIVRMMVGRDMESEYPFDDRVVPGETTFSVEELRFPGGKHEISFTARSGEILGISGLVGSGRTETVRAIFGADPREAGRVLLHGKEVDIASPRDAIRHGVCLLTEDRKEQGLILDMPCDANVTITNLPGVSRFGILDTAKERTIADKLIQDLSIRTPSASQLVRNLSGGNQQKVVLAKWLYRNAEVLIFDEPTRGIDVGAKYEIYLLLWELARGGKTIIVVSSDLPELLGICHRIVVISNGRISGELERQDFDQEKILSLAYAGYIEQPTSVHQGGTS